MKAEGKKNDGAIINFPALPTILANYLFLFTALLPACVVFLAAVFARVLPLPHHTYVMEVHQIAQLLDQTLSPDGAVINAATDALDHLSTLPEFPFTLLSIAIGTLHFGCLCFLVFTDSLFNCRFEGVFI